MVLIVDHHPIGAHVDPVGVWILGDDAYARAQIAATVLFVPPGLRELPQVDVIALEDVLGDGTVADDGGQDRLGRVHEPFPGVHQVERTDASGQPEADG